MTKLCKHRHNLCYISDQRPQQQTCKALCILLQDHLERPGLVVIKYFSCSTQLSIKFQLLIRIKMLKKNRFFLFFMLSDVVCILISGPGGWRSDLCIGVGL